MSLRAEVHLWPRRALALPVRAYRFFLSPWLGSACRFEPTCSRYALDALEQHGAAKGAYLATRRVLRCHPWCHGGRDPVPPPSNPAPNSLTKSHS
jgi:putative membrane protein insertion efficiency factor